ncbi:hypothetical protein [Flavobacterium sp. 38-13]|jgi:hypothetical protein|uniref:hypothetical protein n=1 Tax=Flavobacterium sp. 38-13 TaxID=1896168 RepID=UPI00096899CA|nr:hypothetical protein [Flavobacterium sp. 38-13]OJX54273.1 MAG: hypothetical protein BGO88_11510 [Flavobacterium sp. 38-13]THD33920.1 MAG: hypothetical protein DI588_01920 [Flavobacterium johnsoniae]
MKINPKTGIDKLVFGMLQKDVEEVYGKPDKTSPDEDGNRILQYNKQKIRLTFYKDEDFRLGYLITSNPEVLLFDKKIIGRPMAEVQKELETAGWAKWEKEEFDTLENFFNEANWTILQAEFDEVVKVEIGAIINDKDEFEWKFKK